MKDILISIGVTVIIPFAVYFLVAFILWMFNDPLNIIPTIEQKQRSAWSTCTEQASYIFKDMNNTWGSTYALEDTPSKSVQDFIRLCMEENKK